MNEKLQFRPALPDDAEMLALLIEEVSAGVVPLLLHRLLPGISASRLLSMVLRDESSHYSYRNCIIAENTQQTAGLLFAYPSELQSIPSLMESTLPAARLEPARELLTLRIPGSLYINTLWVDETLRGQGLAGALVDYARTWAEDSGLSALSLFAWADNVRATSFYQRHGFRPVRTVTAEGPLHQLHPQGGHVYVLECKDGLTC